MINLPVPSLGPLPPIKGIIYCPFPAMSYKIHSKAIYHSQLCVIIFKHKGHRYVYLEIPFSLDFSAEHVQL